MPIRIHLSPCFTTPKRRGLQKSGNPRKAFDNRGLDVVYLRYNKLKTRKYAEKNERNLEKMVR